MLKPWDEMMEDNMSQVQIKVTSAFMYAGKVVEIDEVIAVAKGFAREMIHAQKAELVPPGQPVVIVVESSPEVPALSTQTVDIDTPEPVHSGRRSRS
jgi:hypothetical protein